MITLNKNGTSGHESEIQFGVMSNSRETSESMEMEYKRCREPNPPIVMCDLSDCSRFEIESKEAQTVSEESTNGVTEEYKRCQEPNSPINMIDLADYSRFEGQSETRLLTA